ncbi:MAG TPA: hypothetical protein VHG33_10830, partial [Woeseiaceae bacterium]|nr:hypothetical protein [Woeseiaceae bacterium]
MRDVLRPAAPVGPLLFCRGWRDGCLHLAALLVRPEAAPDSVLWAQGVEVSPEVLHRRLGYRVIRYQFALEP